MSPSVYTTLSRQSLESRADKVLDALHGYMHRQEWQKADRAFVADLLQDWDQQVTTLLHDRERLMLQCQALKELSRRYEWRLAGQGWLAYLKFLLGVTKCPSR